MVAARLALVLLSGVSPVAFLALLLMPVVWGSRTVRRLTLAAAATAFGLLLDVSMFIHYAAPLVALLIILSFLILARLDRFARAGDPHPPKAIALLVLMVMFAWPLNRTAHVFTSKGAVLEPRSRIDRHTVAERVSHEPGRHVIFVRYGTHRDFEWVFNGADIDSQKVVWAHDLGPARDLELMRYYAGRRFWSLLVDTPNAVLTPLP
jgi:hypothetical protein